MQANIHWGASASPSTPMKPIAFIEIAPQFGLSNTKIESGMLTPVLSGFVLGIVFAKWFL